ncbi:MAG: hypothetical protein DIU62_006575 [Pseudomonadota bacterium]|jgi:hypothetical protein
MIIVGSLPIQTAGRDRRTVSDRIQKAIARTGLVSGPVLVIGLALFGILPVFLQ